MMSIKDRLKTLETFFKKRKEGIKVLDIDDSKYYKIFQL